MLRLPRFFATQTPLRMTLGGLAIDKVIDAKHTTSDFLTQLANSPARCAQERSASVRGNDRKKLSSMRYRSYYVYLMSSLSRTLYIGVTNDLDRRVQEHKAGAPRSFTARYNIRRLVYCEEFNDVNEAIAREKELDRVTQRAGKIKLIESVESAMAGFEGSMKDPGFFARQPRAGMTN